MNVIRTITQHARAGVGESFRTHPDPTNTYAIIYSSTGLQRYDLTTFAVISPIVPTPDAYIHEAVFDGTNWWYAGGYFHSSTYYLNCADFSSGAISHNTVLAKFPIFLCCIAGTLYIITDTHVYSADPHVYNLQAFDLAGTLLSTITISPALATPLSFVEVGGHIWCSNASGTLYRITTSGVSTAISTGLSTDSKGLILIPDSSVTNLHVIGRRVAGVSSWGHVALSGTSFVLAGSSIGSVPPGSGLAQPIYDLDSDNWLGIWYEYGVYPGTVCRINKTYGLQDAPGPVQIQGGDEYGDGSYTGGTGFRISQPTPGNFLFFGNDYIQQFSFATDNNPITPSSSWQETAPQSIISPPPGAQGPNSSIHNFQFTGVAGDTLVFTVDTAVDSNSVFYGFNAGTVPYISIHDDTTEQMLTHVSGKTLTWIVPSNGSYSVRFQLDPSSVHSTSATPVKLGYSIPLIAVALSGSCAAVSSASGVLTVTLSFAAGTCYAASTTVAGPLGAYMPSGGLNILEDDVPVGQPIRFEATEPGPFAWRFNGGEETGSTNQNVVRSFKTPGTKLIALEYPSDDVRFKTVTVSPTSHFTREWSGIDATTGAAYTDKFSLRLEGPKKLSYDIVVFVAYASDPSTQRIRAFDEGDGSSFRDLGIPTADLLDVTPGRMHTFAGYLWFVGCTSDLFYLSDAYVEVLKYTYPGYLLKSLIDTGEDYLWVLASSTDNSRTFILQVNYSTGAMIPHEINVLDGINNEVCSLTHVRKTVSGRECLAFTNSSVVRRGGDPYPASSIAKIVAIDTFEESAFFPPSAQLILSEPSRPNIWTFSSSWADQPTKHHNQDGYWGFIEEEQSELLVYQAEWIDEQNVLAFCRDNSITGDYTGVLNPVAQKNSGMSFLGLWNVVLRQWVWQAWDFEWIQDPAE